MKLWRVDDVMTKDVVSVREDAPYRAVVDLLIGRRVSAVPVVDRAERVIGVVSEADLLHKVEAAGGTHPRISDAWRRRGDRAKGGRPDLLKVHQRTDADIRRDVVDEALPDVLAIRGAYVQVECADGIVTLSGLVRFRSTAERIARMTRRVPGVVDVVVGLTFEIDDSLINGSEVGTPFGVA
jgi:CBS domain-containing protein